MKRWNKEVRKIVSYKYGTMYYFMDGTKRFVRKKPHSQMALLCNTKAKLRFIACLKKNLSLNIQEAKLLAEKLTGEKKLYSHNVGWIK